MKWLRRFVKRTKTQATNHASPQTTDKSLLSEVSNQASTDAKNQDFFSDIPISDPDFDRFGRWPFAQRVAQTIAARTDSSSLVIGIYGSWGEGKTSVLRFIERELQNQEQIICITFNPWRYAAEEQLIKQFYNTVAVALGSSLETNPERIGRILRGHAAFFDLLDKGGSLAKGIIDYLANVTPEKYKERLEGLLSATKKRVVILMDDIDRLDRVEIQSVFRLVKLSADFAFTAYILAFDQEIVADALGEQYGSGGKVAGGKFLEKIISVPLKLPQADAFALRTLCLEGIERTLQQAEIKLTDSDQALFFRVFDRILLRRLRTPRMVKRYNNAVLFAMPILKGEVYPVDVMIIEGLRVCYTQIYDSIREHSDVLLYIISSPLERERFKTHATDTISRIFSEIPGHEVASLIDTLKELFPGLEHAIRGDEYREAKALFENKRIGSRYYFYRYFSYSISKSDIRDHDIEVFLETIEAKSTGETSALLAEVVKTENAANSLLRLRTREEGLSPNQAKNLAIALAQNGHLFKNVDNLGFPASRYFAISSYVYDLVQQIPEDQGKLDTAMTIATTGDPIFFVIEFMRWTDNPRYKPETKLSTDQRKEIGKIIAARIADFTKKELLYDPSQEYATSLIWTWANCSSKEDVTQYIVNTLHDSPDNITKLLGQYLSFSLFAGAESVRDRYEELSKSVDTGAIYQILLDIYGDTVEYPNPDNNINNQDPSTFPARLAHIFAYLYLNPRNDNQTSNENE
jgi:KAP family P-loop domain